VRYAVAKELLDGAMDEIEFEDTNEGLRESKPQGLPKSISIKASELGADSDDEDTIYDAVSDYLSDRFGFCHFGFSADIVKNEDDEPSVIKVTDIEWDTNESVNKSRLYGAMNEAFDDMEPEVWDYPDTDSRYRDTYSYSPYDNAHNEIADRIRRKGYIGSSSHSDGMTPINLDDKCAPKFNKNYLRSEKKKKELLGV
jgi:hypothetical protein